MKRVTSHPLGAAQSTLLGHVLHIGAGLCDALPDYLAVGSDAVILVEPDPDTALILRDQTAPHPQVSVREIAVSIDTEKQFLHRFSFASLNSLRAPTGLANLFSGLDSPAKHPVQVIDPADLVWALNLPDTANHMLVLEAPGEAMDILQALNAADLLDKFKYLQIREGCEALYQGATPLADIRNWLTAHFFNKDVICDESDPDQPVLSLTYNMVAAQKARYEKILSTAQSEMATERDQIQKDMDQLAGVNQNLRIQALREMDLKDIQSRFKALLQEKDARS